MPNFLGILPSKSQPYFPRSSESGKKNFVDVIQLRISGLAKKSNCSHKGSYKMEAGGSEA